MWLNHTARANANFVTATGPLARAFLLANFATPARLNTVNYWRFCKTTTIKFAALVLVVNTIGWLWKGLPDIFGPMILAWTVLLWLRPWFIPHYRASFICGLILWALNALYVIYIYTHQSVLPGEGAALLGEIAFGFCYPAASRIKWRWQVTLPLAWIGICIEILLAKLGADYQLDTIFSLGLLLPLCCHLGASDSPQQPIRKWINKHSLLVYGLSLIPCIWWITRN